MNETLLITIGVVLAGAFLAVWFAAKDYGSKKAENKIYVEAGKRLKKTTEKIRAIHLEYDAIRKRLRKSSRKLPKTPKT